MENRGAIRGQSSSDFARIGAAEARADGYQALKTDPFAWARNRTGPFQGASLLEWLTPGMIAASVEWIEAIREGVGPDYEVMVDAHARFDVGKGRELSNQGLLLARELGDHAAESKVLWNLMLLEYYEGQDREQAIVYGEQSRAIARQLGLE